MNIKNVVGASYRLANGLVFKVVHVESYPQKKISKQYEHILTIKPGYLAAIMYRGTLIPNITLEEGVVRLMSVEVDGVLIKTPKAISSVLGIENAIDAYLLKKLN